MLNCNFSTWYSTFKDVTIKRLVDVDGSRSCRHGHGYHTSTVPGQWCPAVWCIRSSTGSRTHCMWPQARIQNFLKGGGGDGQGGPLRGGGGGGLPPLSP